VVVLADRLTTARRRGFVGRRAQLDAFRAMLAPPGASGADACVLYVHGPGGVGKTTLLRECAAFAATAGCHVTWLDGREPGGYAAGGGGAGRREVLVVDTAESLGPLDAWLREQVVPGLPADAVVVIAGRDPPPIEWRTDPGWQSLLRSERLDNLDPGDAAELLRQRGVPERAHAAALRVTHGHPLGLALMADICRQTGAAPTPADTREVLSALIGELVDAVPTGAHRAALEACAQVRVTTEPLLAALLGVPECATLFGWLRGLSVVEQSARGLFPHDLAREALAAELRWRHPEQHAEIRRRARAYYRARFPGADFGTQQGILADYAFLHRQSPGLGAMLAYLSPGAADAGGLSLAPATPADLPALRAMVAAHEGEESAALFDHWCAAAPDAVQAVRAAGGTGPAGLQVVLALERATPAQRAADPAAAAAWEYLARHAPPAPGERVLLVRFWLCGQAYQDVSPVQTMLALHLVRLCLTTPRLAYHFLPTADPQAWEPICAYAHLRRLPAADFTVGGRRYGVFGHDWRATPPMAWLGLLADREDAETAGVAGAPPAPSPAAPSGATGEVIGEADFARAVRAALRDLARPDRLADSPLGRTRAVAGGLAPDAGATEVGRAVARLIREGAAVLAGSVPDRAAYRALHHTYLQPAGTQQAAADLLDLPTSTYRRHLATGVRQLTAILWRRERDTR
jgi:hypothetical protein